MFGMSYVSSSIIYNIYIIDIYIIISVAAVPIHCSHLLACSGGGGVSSCEKVSSMHESFSVSQQWLVSNIFKSIHHGYLRSNFTAAPLTESPSIRQLWLSESRSRGVECLGADSTSIMKGSKNKPTQQSRCGNKTSFSLTFLFFFFHLKKTEYVCTHWETEIACMHLFVFCRKDILRFKSCLPPILINGKSLQKLP